MRQWNRVSIGSDNGLSPIRRQYMTWINVAALAFGPLETIFKEFLIEIFIQENPFEKRRLENGGHFVSTMMC